MKARLTLGALALAAGLITAHAATPAAPPDTALPPEVLQALAAAGVPPEAMAVAVLPLAAAQPRAQPPVLWRAKVPMQPASTMKLVTSVVALDRLGPGHRSSTTLLSAAPLLADGTLQGDIVLKGGADPELDLPQFWAMLVDLKARGVTTIAGDLLLDRTLFRPARMDVGLAPFDQAPEFQYNVIPDAVELAGNLLPLEISADAATVRATAVPALEGLEISASRMTITAGSCGNWDADWKPALVQKLDDGRTRIELQGGFPANCTKRTGLQLIDRLELAERLFRTLWKGLGGQWTGQAREAPAPAGAQLLVKRSSRPWGEVLRPMNKTSDNPVTRLLFLQLGVPLMAVDASTPTTELAAKVVQEWFRDQDIDTTGLVLDNGSGLSRSERITPLQLASLLAAAWRGKNAADLVMSLPIVGVDGSLRLKDSPAAGWARLKPGTLRNVVALAGYVRDAQGRPWAISMMINHDDASKARPALLAFVDHFARVGPAPRQAVRRSGAR